MNACHKILLAFFVATMLSSAIACFDLFDVGAPKAAHNATTPAGKKYEDQLSVAFEKVVSPKISQCLEGLLVYEGDDFSLVMQLSKEGKVELSAARPNTPLTQCLTTKLSSVMLPPPPWQAFWIRMNYSSQ